MKKFNIGDRVIVIEDNEVKKGTITSIYPEVCTFIVRFDDGSVGKVSSKNIALEPKAETIVEPEAQEKHEDAPRMKSEITITPDEFRKISVDVLTDYLFSKDEISEKFSFGLSVLPIFVAISDRLFCEKESENSDNDK